MEAFSLVSTVFNEARRLQQTLADLQAQRLQPSEIVLVDAGSTDGTWAMLQAWQERSSVPVVLLQEPGCNVARGRNLAIERARWPLIASTDFGCRFHPDWLAELMQPFADPTVEVVGGAFAVQADEVHGPAAQADWVLQHGYPVQMDDRFSVSSRSIAYRKYVWQQLGGYPEWLSLAADDTVFWRLVRKAGFRYVFSDKPLVFWLRHRSFRGFAREAYRYGLGDGESGINLRNTLSHVAETALRYALLVILTCWACFPLGLWAATLLPIGWWGLRSYRRAVVAWWHLGRPFGWRVLPSCFYAIEYQRWSYLRGYWRGFFRSSAKVRAQRRQLAELL